MTLHSGIFFSVEFSSHVGYPHSEAKKWFNMVVTWVSHSCLLIELDPICNSMAASLLLKSCEDHNLLKSYNGGIWKNNYRSGPYNLRNANDFRTLHANTNLYPFPSTWNSLSEETKQAPSIASLNIV